MQQLDVTSEHPFECSHGKAAVWSRAVAGAARLWRQAQRRRLLRATARTLDGLSDRTLHDIGIDRSEIGAVVAGLDGNRCRGRYDGGARRWVQ